ncbi:MAG: NYN domain-containing protein [Deltaproteobacteria bacterium]|nr:NYN domain-containing protein [Deltaproteobacteria bacterium]
MAKKRVCCYIDGFNLYHSIAALGSNCNHLKWLNLWALSNAYIKSSKEKLVKVYYFSAIAYWLKDSSARHKQFIEANKNLGVTPILGNFKKKTRQCKSCGAKWTEHEEKQSDVNLAIYLVNDAHLNKFDKAFVLSADSDLCPPIDLVINNCKKEAAILIPPNRYKITRELRNRQQVTAYKIKLKHLKANQLPNTIRNETGEIIIKRPEEYIQNKN